MLWVLDRRAGVYNRAELLSRLGALVNTYKQYQMWPVGGCTHYCTYWGDICMGTSIFECSRVGLLYASLIGNTCP